MNMGNLTIVEHKNIIYKEIISACQAGDTNTLKSWHEKGVDFNGVVSAETGFFAIHEAANNLKSLEFLISCGVDLNKPGGPSGETAVSYVFGKSNWKEATKMLVGAGADINQASLEGLRVLQKVVFIDVIEGADMILDLGANPILKNKKGLTPLEKIVEHQIRSKNYGWAREINQERLAVIIKMIDFFLKEHKDILNGRDALELSTYLNQYQYFTASSLEIREYIWSLIDKRMLECHLAIITDDSLLNKINNSKI